MYLIFIKNIKFLFILKSLFYLFKKYLNFLL